TLHLAGVVGTPGRRPVTLDEIKRFRQLHSCTPGHPESELTSGVETTTGPLGQGVANAVGLALASRWIKANYSRPGFDGLFGFRDAGVRPVFVTVKSVIGYGAPKRAGTKEAHGEPLGADEVKAAKRTYGWPEDAQFLVPDGVYGQFQKGVGARGAAARKEWEA